MVYVRVYLLYKYTYRVSNKKSYSRFWLVFKNACANFIQTYHEHSPKDGKIMVTKADSLDGLVFGLVRIRPLRSDLTISEPWDEGDGFE